MTAVRSVPAAGRQTAEQLLTRRQVVVALAALVVLAAALVVTPQRALQVVVTATTLFYLAFVGLKLALHLAALRWVPPADAPVGPDDPDLPSYTVLVPLYREANMLPALAASLDALRYPRERLQVLLLLEADDAETRAAAAELDLPPWWEVVVVPDVRPRGKPKALNLGLARATGDLTVIYDAEDRPDADQLLTAVAAFRASGPDLACVQARLVFWNDDTSWVTRFYWMEYVVHFEWVLPGLARLGLVPPLGGTSNHFRTAVLREVALPHDALPVGAQGVGGWDPWNVTEDAELAGALAAARYRVAIIDSVTREEATARLAVADKQRRRWLKGYLQTGLVFLRDPVGQARRMGPAQWAVFVLVMVGNPLSLLLNPLYWGLAAVYFATRSPAIEALYPPWLFYPGVVLLVVGNLLLFYQLTAACLHRGGYGTVKYVLMTPLWWACTSWSAYQVLWELARPSTRHTWNKTPHGHDLVRERRDAALSPEEAVPVGLTT